MGDNRGISRTSHTDSVIYLTGSTGVRFIWDLPLDISGDVQCLDTDRNAIPAIVHNLELENNDTGETQEIHDINKCPVRASESLLKYLPPREESVSENKLDGRCKQRTIHRHSIGYKGELKW